MAAVSLGSRKDRRMKKKSRVNMGLILALMGLALAGFLYIRPAFQQQPLNTTGYLELYYEGEKTGAVPFYRGEQLYLPYIFVKEYLDIGIAWDQKKKMLIITGREDVYHLEPGSREGLHNLERFLLDEPIIMEEDVVYLPAELVERLYAVRINNIGTEKLVSIRCLNKPIQTGVVQSKVRLRSRPQWRSFWVRELDAGEEAEVKREEQGWFWVETPDGRMGFVQKSRIQLCAIKDEHQKEEPFKPWNPTGEPILLTWEFVYTKTVDPERIGDLSGLHVLSPTWFQLAEEGVVHNKADRKYVDWVHRQGRKVWGVFSNECKIDLTHSFLADSRFRLKAIEQLKEYAEEYELDGLDIDFEYMYMEDKAAYVQFIKELVPVMHAKGLTVNVYVIFHSNSERWSKCYDHSALAESADYLTVMAYDQHTVLAGSVASLPWVEKGVVRMLEDVPQDKLILGIPLYTRLWKEEPGEDGRTKTTPRTLTMEQADGWLAEHEPLIRQDNETGQHYVEISEGSTIYRMWLEDFFSLQKRVELVKKYRLAGLAAWRRGVEKEGVWQYLTELSNSRW